MFTSALLHVTDTQATTKGIIKEKEPQMVAFLVLMLHSITIWCWYAAPILHGEQITFLHMLTLHRWDVHGPCSTWRQAQDNWSRAPIRVWGPDYYPLTGRNPGLSLACLLDITPWEDIYLSWGYVMTPFVGNAVLRRKPQSTFCVSVRLWPHSGIHIWVPSFWTWRILVY